MCGIVACAARGDGVDDLMAGLDNLEYRGYDSAGIAVQNGDGIEVVKREGDLSALRTAVAERSLDGGVGVGHTRWSTHGEPDHANAHPHTDCSGRVAVVHNGVIENHDELRHRLDGRGHSFDSDTDTEVIPHLVEERLDSGDDPETAFRTAVEALDGSYAVAAVVEGFDEVLAARQDSPLVVGHDSDRHYLASDVPAFLRFTDRVTYLEDGDVATITPADVAITDGDGEEVMRTVETVDWDREEVSKGRFDHFMEKEIHAQPDALAQTIRGRVDDGEVALDELPDEAFASVEKVQLLGCGTSYHAALCGAKQLSRVGIDARPHRASEYGDPQTPDGDDTLAVAVTQSGETADTLSAIEQADEAGARTIAVTNVVGSSVTRAVEESLFIRAGPEIGVAATKTFSSQAVLLTLLAQRLARELPAGQPREDRQELLDAIERLPTDLRTVLDGSRAEWIARECADQDAFFFIGRDLGHPVALEGALKFKEITYEHAEGFASGELKHGPLALVTPDTPVFAVFTGRDDEKTVTNAEEVRARGADIVTIGPDGDHGVGDVHLTVPDTHPALAGLAVNVQLQRISYQTAELLDRDIDKPRNLAKSVTVE